MEIIIKCAIISLSVIIMIAFMISFIPNRMIDKTIKYIECLNLEDPADFEAAVALCYGEPVEVYDNATLLCTEQYAQTNEIIMIYDFSKWEDSRIIGITGIHKDAQIDEDEEPYINIVPNQKVCKYEDGSIIWLRK